MTMTANFISSDSKLEEISLMATGESVTDPVAGLETPIPNTGSIPRIEYNIHDFETSATNHSKPFNFGNGNAVFDSNGPMRTKSQAYYVRICVLRRLATQDGYSLNPASEYDFWGFEIREQRLRKGNLVLMDNGNLRAVWKDNQGSRLGIQFLGGGMVQYVIFKKREATLQTSRVAGRDTLEGLRRQIESFELDSLLYE